MDSTPLYPSLSQLRGGGKYGPHSSRGPPWESNLSSHGLKRRFGEEEVLGHGMQTGPSREGPLAQSRFLNAHQEYGTPWKLSRA